jgi:hypothetical protein
LCSFKVSALVIEQRRLANSKISPSSSSLLTHVPLTLPHVQTHTFSAHARTHTVLSVCRDLVDLPIFQASQPDVLNGHHPTTEHPPEGGIREIQTFTPSYTMPYKAPSYKLRLTTPLNSHESFTDVVTKVTFFKPAICDMFAQTLVCAALSQFVAIVTVMLKSEFCSPTPLVPPLVAIRLSAEYIISGLLCSPALRPCRNKVTSFQLSC